jgi:hypothetical protein
MLRAMAFLAVFLLACLTWDVSVAHRTPDGRTEFGFQRIDYRTR